MQDMLPTELKHLLESFEWQYEALEGVH
jgi:hypothetical protein